MTDTGNIAHNLFTYVQGFLADVRDIFDHFNFQAQIERLAKAGLLYQVAEKFAQIDLHPDHVSNMQMGLVFEELIRKFAEISNETAGEHFTPRNTLSDDGHIEHITQQFGRFEEVTDDEGRPISRIFANEAFGHNTITVERPLAEIDANLKRTTHRIWDVTKGLSA